jgi:acetyl esterase/lipase
VVSAAHAAGPDALGAGEADMTQTQCVDEDGALEVQRFMLPISRYMSEEARRRFIAHRQSQQRPEPGVLPPLREIRRMAEEFYRPLIATAHELFAVEVEDIDIAGKPVQIITPTSSAGHVETRLLINLHGGGFTLGSRSAGLVESIAVAATARMKVISIDYRLAPEHRHPAAIEDVATVYSRLLADGPAARIGLFGTSAGGSLAAMAVSWFQDRGLPRPGALGIFAAGAFAQYSGASDHPGSWGGDSRFVGPALIGEAVPLPGCAHADTDVYVEATEALGPIGSPCLHPIRLRHFPPTLCVSGTRSFDLSAAVETHRQLTKAGVDARLHIWDGMDHAFFTDPSLPESREVYDVAARFFLRHLIP